MRRLLIIVVLFLAAPLVTVAPCAAAGGDRAGALGRVNFPVTGSDAARRLFVRGLLALHSFWYDEARELFQEATRVQPDFAMGRWGEALTYFHPVWANENAAATKKALDAVPRRPAITPRELAYLDAARALVGDGDFAGHAARYRDAMKAVHERFPDDDEAAALYAVAILGTLDRKSPSYRLQAEAGALMLDLFARHPDHPGAAHYIIHAFDDPDHAPLALPAARRYARIAPEAFHALHMPSHIFVHLGLWADAVASNESAWAASRAWVARRGLDVSRADFHSLSWLHAAYLELGQRQQAEAVLARERDAVAEAREDRVWMRVDYLKMLLKSAIEGDDFTDLDRKVDALGRPPPEAARAPEIAPAATAAAPSPPSSATCHPAQPESDQAKGMRRERGYRARLRAEQALAERNETAALAAIEQLMATLTAEDRRSDGWRIVELTLRGRATALRGGLEAGLTMLAEAADLQDRESPSGPVESGATARERLAELLRAAGRSQDAVRAFRRVLDQHPRRARALLGWARAATAAGDPSARAAWAQLASLWARADPDTPGLAEMRRALATP